MALQWSSCGGGAQQTECKTWYLQLTRRYLGRGRYDRFVTLCHRPSRAETTHDTIRLAKIHAAAAKQ